MSPKTQTHQTVGIIGCGWLGFPLGKFLVQKGYKVYGTTTTPSKLKELSAENIKPIIFNIDEDQIEKIDRILSCDCIIFNLPPTHIKTPFSDFLKKLYRQLNPEKLPRLIFISSTSVYGDSEGLITEEDELKPQTRNAKILTEAENFLLREKRNCIILRPAGLIGYDRKPGRFLAGRENLPNPDHVVNLVHRDDVVEIIFRFIQIPDAKQQTLVFNICMDEHPERKSFYQSAAKSHGFAPPSFLEKTGKSGKIIDNAALKVFLNYEFIFKNPFTTL